MDIQNASPNSRNTSKITYALHSAARYGNVECISVLCDFGFDLNFVTDEGSALHVAAMFGQVETVKLLVEYGIDLMIRDCDGKTALERLHDYEGQNNLDLTHTMQSMQCWVECRILIEG